MTAIVTFGETMLRLSPPPGDRIETTDYLECYTAGAESNVAIAAARLCADVTWLSKLPDTVLGRRVVQDIRSHGVAVEPVWSEDGRLGTYYLEQAGQPRGSTVIYDREGAAVKTATTGELETELVADAELFFTTGITPALSDTLYDTTRALLETAQRTAFDLNYRSKLWSPTEARAAFDELLPDVDLLFAPERDVETVLDIGGPAREVAERLRSEYGCETVVLTRGDDGAVAVTEQAVFEQPAYAVETIDPIGTGDAFVGAYLAQWLDGASIEDALQWGAAAAALKRTVKGDVACISPAEVRAVIADDHAAIDR